MRRLGVVSTKAFYDLFIADCRMPLIWVNVNQAKRAHLSIQQAEHPKGNSVAGTRLDVIDGKVAVGLVLDLVEGLAGAAYLKPLMRKSPFCGMVTSATACSWLLKNVSRVVPMFVFVPKAAMRLVLPKYIFSGEERCL